MNYANRLTPIKSGPAILADYPEFIEPLQCERRFMAPALVDERDADLRVRTWRYSYNARGIVEMENRLRAKAAAGVMVHPWGIDDAEGLKTPEPAGASFFGFLKKNLIALEHMKKVVTPFLDRIRGKVSLIGYSLPGVEDQIRKMLYASISTSPSALNVPEGRRQLRELLDNWQFKGDGLIPELELDPDAPVSSYFSKAPSTQTCPRYDRDFRLRLPMPLSAGIRHAPEDLVFYDEEGYPKVRDFLKGRGIRHILLFGYATDMCLIRTTCGYQNFCRDFNVFIVGDATLATFPGSATPRFATQTALANAALSQLITQVGWVKTDNNF